MKPLCATCTNTCTPRTRTHTVPGSSSAPTEQENEYKASTQQSQPLLAGSHKNKLLLTHEITEMYINQRNLPFAKCLRHTGKTLRDRNLNISILKTHVLFTDKKAE